MSTVIVALVLAAFGTLAVLVYVRGADDRAVAGKKAVRVLVAAKVIPAGTPGAQLRSADLVRTVKMPAETVPDDTLSEINDDVEDLVTSTSIAGGQLIRRPLMVPKGDQTDGITIPDGKIALTIALTEPQRVAGYVRPGSKVAIFMTYRVLGKDGKPKGDVTGTRLLLSGIEVLAIGSAAKGNASGGSDPKTLVTLAVTQRQAEKLIYGARGDSQGNSQSGLHLGLQTDSSQLSEQSSGIDSSSIFG